MRLTAKRFIVRICLLAACLLLSSAYANTIAVLSDELNTEAKYQKLKETGVFESWTGSENMTREEFAEVLVKLLGKDKPDNGNDLPYSDWAAGFAIAVENKWILGDGQGNYLHDSYITTEQLATIMIRALNLDPTPPSMMHNGVSDWAQGYVQAALQHGLISWNQDYTKPATREQIVDASYATYEKNQESEAKETESDDNKLVCEQELFSFEGARLDMDGPVLIAAFSAPVNLDSLSLSRITLDSIKLSELDSEIHLELSEDGKTVRIHLGEGFEWKTYKNHTTLYMAGVQSACGNLISANETIWVDNLPPVPLPVITPIYYPPSPPPADPVEEEPEEEEPSHLVKVHDLTTVVGATYSTMHVEVIGWNYLSVIALESDHPAPTLEELKLASYSAFMPFVCAMYDLKEYNHTSQVYEIELYHFSITNYNPDLSYTFYILGMSDDVGTEASDVYTTTYTEVFDAPNADDDET